MIITRFTTDISFFPVTYYNSLHFSLNLVIFIIWTKLSLTAAAGTHIGSLHEKTQDNHYFCVSFDFSISQNLLPLLKLPNYSHKFMYKSLYLLC